MAVDIFARFASNGIVSTTVVDKSTTNLSILLVNTPASAFTITPNDTYQDLNQPDCNGNEQRVFRYVKSSLTNGSANWNIASGEMKSVLGLNKQMTLKATNSMKYIRAGVTVPDEASPQLTASATGIYGEGLAADAVTLAAYSLEGISLPLTQSNFTGFVHTGTLGFAMGANGAMKFTNDLRGKVVSLTTEYSATNVYTSAGAAVKDVEITVNSVDSYGNLWQTYLPSVAPERQAINWAEPGQGMQFSVNGDFEVRKVGKLNRC